MVPQARGTRIELLVEPFEALTKAQRQGLDEEANRMGAFYGLEPRLTLR